MSAQNSLGPVSDAPPIARLKPFRKSRRGIIRFIPNSRSRFSLLKELSLNLQAVLGSNRAHASPHFPAVPIPRSWPQHPPALLNFASVTEPKQISPRVPWVVPAFDGHDQHTRQSSLWHTDWSEL